MQASDPSELTGALRDVSRRAVISYFAAIVAMSLTIAVASAVLRRLASTLPTTADPRFFTHYAAGPSMPFPVIMDHDSGFTFVAVFLAFAVGMALLSLWAARSLRGIGKAAPQALILGLVAVLLVMLGFSTTFSIDEYAYAAFGRLLGIHWLNPYVQRLADGSTLGDPVLAQIATLTGTPLPDDNYGPLWTWLSAGLTFVSQFGGLMANVIAQRAAAAVALLVATLGVCRLYREVPAGERERRTALFAFHPLAMYESAGAGHNDMLMIAPAVWAFALVDSAPWAAGLLVGAAIAVKYVALLVLPFVAIRAHGSRGLSGSTACVGLAFAVPVLLFAPLWPGAAAIGALFNLGSTLIVSPQWLIDTWIPALGDRVVGIAFIVAVLLVLGFSVRCYSRDRRGAHIFRTIAALVWSSPLLNPWYVQWLMPAAASAGRWGRYAWWFGLFVMMRYVEDAPRFPSTQADMSSRIGLLAAATIAILVAPAILSLVGDLPLQRAVRRVAPGDA